MEAIPTLIVLLLIAAAIALWLYTLVDIVRTPESELRSASKTTWALIVLLAHVPGAVLYLLLGRPTRATRS